MASSPPDALSYGSGIAAILTCTILNSCGILLQRAAHSRLARSAVSVACASPAPTSSGAAAAPSAPAASASLASRGWFCLSPLWVLGVACQVGGGACAVVALLSIGQARCAAFAGLTLVWSQLLAAAFLGEQATWVDAAGTALIVAGSTVAAVWGAEGAGDASHRTYSELLGSLRSEQARVGGAVIGLAAGAALGVLARLRWRWAAEAAAGGGSPPGTLGGRGGARGGAARRSAVECTLLSVTAGICSCAASASVKLLSAAVASAGGGGGALLASPEVRACALGLAAALALQLTFLNSALRRYDVLSAVPPYQCTLTLLGVASGWVFLGESAGASMTGLLYMSAGAALCAAGVLLLGCKESVALAAAAAAAKATAAAAGARRQAGPCTSTAPPAAPLPRRPLQRTAASDEALEEEEDALLQVGEGGGA